MAVEDVLDQREPEAGAPLRAALADVDAIEALGQPRQVLGRDAGTIVAHRDAAPRARRRRRRRDASVTSIRLPEAPYFSAFSTRFSNTRSSSSRSPCTSSGSGGNAATAPPRRGRGRASAGRRRPGADRHQVACLSGRRCALSSMRDSDKQVVDQAGHAVRLRLHDVEKALARGGVVARRPLQGFDEAGQRGERRAQLVAGIGDEVGAHLLDPPQRREIVERRSAARPAGRRLEPAAIGVTHGLVPAVDRHPLEKFDPLRVRRLPARGGWRRAPPARAARARPARRGASAGAIALRPRR